MSNYRVEMKSNVNVNGKRTSFNLFEQNGKDFVFAGAYTAVGYNASDEKCIAAFHAFRAGE